MNIYQIRTKTYSVLCEEPLPYSPITSPSAALPVLRAIFEDLDANVEHFVVLALNGKGCVIGLKHLSTGIETDTTIDAKGILRAVLVLGGTSFLCAHNHPSGNADPSREDCALTKRLRQAGEIVGLPMADHIILGRATTYSFRVREGWDRI